MYYNKKKFSKKCIFLCALVEQKTIVVKLWEIRYRSITKIVKACTGFLSWWLILILTAHNVRKSRNITGQNRSPIFWYVVLKMQYHRKSIKIRHGCPFEGCMGRKGLDGRSLLGQPSKGHPCRILILFPYCSTISLAPHIKKLETYFALLYFWTFAQCGYSTLILKNCIDF